MIKIKYSLESIVYFMSTSLLTYNKNKWHEFRFNLNNYTRFNKRQTNVANAH